MKDVLSIITKLQHLTSHFISFRLYNFMTFDFFDFFLNICIPVSEKKCIEKIIENRYILVFINIYIFFVFRLDLCLLTTNQHQLEAHI